MKILIDLTSLNDNFSGIERFAMSIAKEIIQLDRKNEYILIFKNEVYKEFKEYEHRKNIDFKIIKGKNKLFFSQVKFPIELYKIKADKYIFLAFPAPIIYFSRGIINAIHDMTPWLYPKTMSLKGLILFKALIKKASICSERIITVSNNSQKDIRSIFPKMKIPIDIIYNGVDLNLSNVKNNRKQLEKYNIDGEYMLCLGTLEPRKNIMLLIEAYIELKNENKIKNNLVIVGRKGWKFKEIIAKVEKNKLEKNIIFTGFVENDDLGSIYANAECFVYPSLYEGFGIPLIEAMSCGVPIIASNSSSIPEVVGNAGILFENNNKKSLKKKILEFNNIDKKEIDIMKNLGYKQIKKFSWKKEGEKLIKIIEKRVI